jgi:hypothetical protein
VQDTHNSVFLLLGMGSNAASPCSIPFWGPIALVRFNFAVLFTSWVCLETHIVIYPAITWNLLSANFVWSLVESNHQKSKRLVDVLGFVQKKLTNLELRMCAGNFLIDMWPFIYCVRLERNVGRYSFTHRAMLYVDSY